MSGREMGYHTLPLAEQVLYRGQNSKCMYSVALKSCPCA